MPDNKTRVKDVAQANAALKGTTPDIQNFYSELHQYFPEINITSGKRTAKEETGKNYMHSHHNTENAIDISFKHKDVYAFLMNDRKGLELLTKYKLGILDETNPATMEKTQATGPHFHIGKDSHYAAKAKERLSNFDHIDPVFAYIDKDKVTPTVQSPTETQTQATVPVGVVEKRIEDGLLPGGVSASEIQKEIDKENIKEQKISQSEARKAIEDKRIEIINQSLPTYANSAQIEYREDTAEVMEDPYKAINLPVQYDLPSLPTI